MKRKILSMLLLGIMVLGVSGTANAGKKNKYYGTGVSSKNNSYIGVTKSKCFRQCTADKRGKSKIHSIVTSSRSK